MNSIQQATANLSNLPIKMIMARLKIPTPPVLEGAGMVLRFPEVIAVTGVKRVLIVAGPNVSASGMVDPFAKALKQNGIDAVLYDKTMPNPTIQNVYDAVKTYNVHQCDAVVGFGGGSSIDCAKIVAAKATNETPVSRDKNKKSHRGHAADSPRCLPRSQACGIDAAFRDRRHGNGRSHPRHRSLCG